ncbi:MAG TPA: hypothetical protein VMV10_29035 [Pirellulales bacterium]|nr:hypothetical protein [Pirellulales bacterium]
MKNALIVLVAFVIPLGYAGSSVACDATDAEIAITQAQMDKADADAALSQASTDLADAIVNTSEMLDYYNNEYQGDSPAVTSAIADSAEELAAGGDEIELGNEDKDSGDAALEAAIEAFNAGDYETACSAATNASSFYGPAISPYEDASEDFLEVFFLNSFAMQLMTEPSCMPPSCMP